MRALKAALNLKKKTQIDRLSCPQGETSQEQISLVIMRACFSSSIYNNTFADVTRFMVIVRFST